MLARLSAFVIWAVVAATAVFWGLRLFVRAPSAPLHTAALGDVGAVRGDLTRLLGVTPAVVADEVAPVQPELAARFKLVGVMAPRPAAASAGSLQGVALIAVDGKPAKAYAVGTRLDGDMVLQSVSQRGAAIGMPQADATLRLELPPLPPPATGSLPPVGAPAAAATVAPPLPPMSQPSPQATPMPAPQQAAQAAAMAPPPQPGRLGPVFGPGSTGQ
jgi:general secretion pathway protein C